MGVSQAEGCGRTIAQRQQSSMGQNKNINLENQDQATAMKAVRDTRDDAVPWVTSRRPLTYSSSSSLSSLGRAWSSSSSSASCFRLRVDIVDGQKDGVMELGGSALR